MRMGPRLVPLAILLVVAGLITPATLGAQTRSEISGTVRDSSGGVLPGVTVTLTSPNLIGSAQTVVTNGGGCYDFMDNSGSTPSVTYRIGAGGR